MRRIEAIAIVLAVFGGGGLIYLLLQLLGLDAQDAGVWAQSLLTLGLIGWVSTYLFRVATKTMTYHQQRQDYEEAMLQKRFDALTPEELEKLQAEIEAEEAALKG